MPIPIGLVLAAGQIGYGLFQQQKAKKALENTTRPTMEIPEEIRSNLSDAQARALEGLPEAQRKNYIRNIQRATTSAQGAAADRRSGLAGIAGIHQQQMDAYSNFFAQDVAARRQNEQALMGARNQMAGYKDKLFDVNQMQPYRQEYNKNNALQAAGTQNMMRGINMGAGAIATAQHNKAIQDALMGSAKTATTQVGNMSLDQMNAMNQAPPPPIPQSAQMPTQQFSINDNQLGLPPQELALQPNMINPYGV